MLGGAALGVVAHLVGEGVGRDVEVVARVPALGLLAGLEAARRERLDHRGGLGLVGLAPVEPAVAARLLVRLTEGVREPLRLDERLQARQLGARAVEALVLVEHPVEGADDRRGVVAVRALAADVEQDGLGGDAGRAPGLGGDHLVLEARLDVVERAPAAHRAIGQQVGQHLEEVRLTGAEEARDPHADLARRLVDGALVGVEERGEVPAQLARDHVLGQLLLDDGLVVLVDFDDAVDVAVDVAFEHIVDAHGRLLSRRGWLGTGSLQPLSAFWEGLDGDGLVSTPGWLGTGSFQHPSTPPLGQSKVNAR